DQLGDLAMAEQYLEAALSAARAAQDVLLLDLALGGLSFVLHRRGEFERAISIADENVQVATKLGDDASIAHAYTRLAELLVLSDQPARAAEAAELATHISERTGDLACLAAALDTLGLARRLSGAPEAAADLLERAVDLHREFGWRANTAAALFRWADAL